MEEKILFEQKVMWYKKKMQAFPGKLTISDKRITFIQDKIKTPGTGLLGSLVANKSKKQELVNYLTGRFRALNL